MKFLLFLLFFLVATLMSEDLKVKANKFSSDEKSGISIFVGDVNVVKGADELNASKVTIYTNKEHKPTKFMAEGHASFRIVTEEGALYRGRAQKVVYYPIEKEYHFFKDVYLQQIDENKEISGDEVVLKSIEGTAYAKGAAKEPVIMIYTMPEKEEKEKKEEKK